MFRNSIWIRIWRMAALVAIIYVVHGQAVRREAQKKANVTLPQAQLLFPNAETLGVHDTELNAQEVLDHEGKSLGKVLLTLPETRAVRGYTGPNQILIGLKPGGEVSSWQLLESADTTEHVDLVKHDARFSGAFTSWSPQQALPSIQAVSGATLTSAAVAQSIQQRLSKQSASLLFPEEVQLSEAQSLFPRAASLTQKEEGLEVYDQQGKLLGCLVRTANDSVTGYAGPTEVLVALSADKQTVQGVKLRRSFDTEGYVQDVRQAPDYLGFFQGRKVTEVVNMDWNAAGVEGVSGATQTSYAVAEGIKQRLTRFITKKQASLWAAYDWLLVAILVLAHVLAFTSLRGKRWLRWLWQVLVIGYVGLGAGSLISLGLLGGWVQHGVAWQLAPSLALLVAAAVLVPWATRRQLYCHHVCPHGALQQWLGGWSKWHIAVPAKLHSLLSYLPWTLLALAFVSLLCGWGWELNAWEPFDAWSWRAGAVLPIMIAVLGLLTSMFIPQAYCRYGCPTGALLKLVRSSGTADHWAARDWSLLLALAVSLWSVVMSHKSPSSALHVCQGQSMGSSWKLKLRGPVPAGLEQEIQAELDRIEALLSTWKKDSAISQFNAYRDTQPHELSPDILHLIQQTSTVAEQSAAALDITVGPLVMAWSFGPPPRHPQPPSEAEIQRLLKATGWRQIEHSSGTLRKLQPEVEIDLCCVAEGWALDRLANRLDALGVDYLMELGGELHSKGRWSVGIELYDKSCILDGSALATSGTYRQERQVGEIKASHLIDPRTGHPVTHCTVSVSVRHKEACLADAWATALAVLGCEKGLPIAERLGLQALFIDEKEGKRIHSTSHW